MKVIYIAGPFRGANHWEQEQNIRRAEALALDVWKTGKAVAVCPHLNTRNFQGVLPDERWLRGDLEILKRCDAVLLTPDWRASKGAVEEAKLAKSLGIPLLVGIADVWAFGRGFKIPTYDFRPFI